MSETTGSEVPAIPSPSELQLRCERVAFVLIAAVAITLGAAVVVVATVDTSPFQQHRLLLRVNQLQIGANFVTAGCLVLAAMLLAFAGTAGHARPRAETALRVIGFLAGLIGGCAVLIAVVVVKETTGTDGQAVTIVLAQLATLVATILLSFGVARFALDTRGE
jgi:hypothetical protein